MNFAKAGTTIAEFREVIEKLKTPQGRLDACSNADTIEKAELLLQKVE